MARPILSDLISRYDVHPNTSPQQEEFFRMHCRRLSASGVQLVAYFLLGGNLISWPTDFLFFKDSPEVIRAFALWRVVMTLCCISGLLMLRSPRIRSSAAFLGGLYILVFIAALTGGFWIGRLGGLEQTFFYTIYAFAGVSTAFFIPLFQRTMLTYGMTLSFILTFFGLHPENLRHPRLPSAIAVCLASDLCYVLLGHVLFLLARKNYFQELALMRKAEELVVANGKSERLLLNVLPAPIAARLKEELRPIADGYSAVTVLFADIVGFTQISARMQPEELVHLLNKIFSDFDRIADQLGLEKIKTIGDAYMVAAGLPSPRKDHAQAIAKMALAMHDIIVRYQDKSGAPLHLRVGIHTGSVVAGVIGSRKFIYDLWGDTVNTASRMESHGLPDEIQVTQATMRLLCDSYVLTPRGQIDVKGIGPMPTWLLKGPGKTPVADQAG